MAMMEGQQELMWVKLLVVFLVGPWDTKIAVLAVFFLIDLSSGVYAARHKGTYSHLELLDKTQRKLYVYVVSIIAMNMMDILLGLPNTSRNGFLFMLICAEMWSTTSNIAKLGHGHVARILNGFYEQLMNQSGMKMDESEKGQGDEEKQRGEKDEES